MVSKETKKRIIQDITGGTINSLLISPFFISSPPLALGVGVATFGIGITIEELKRFKNSYKIK